MPTINITTDPRDMPSILALHLISALAALLVDKRILIDSERIKLFKDVAYSLSPPDHVAVRELRQLLDRLSRDPAQSQQ